jgi:cytochrome c oxidase subunit II
MLQALLAQAYSEKYSYWLPQAASKNAGEYDYLFYFILGINILFSSLIMATMIYFVLRYRHRKNAKHDPTAGHSTALELTWTIIPTLIVIGIFYYGFRSYLRANVMPPEAYEITANGQMWSWSFTYPNGYTSPGELHLVVNQPTRMVLQSADVIHDLAIPAFRMKKDDVPGRYNREYFEPNVATKPAEPLITFDCASQVIPPTKTVEEEKGGDYGLYTQKGVVPTKSVPLVPGDTFGFATEGGKSLAVYTHDGKTGKIELDPKASPQYIWKTPYGYFQVFCAMYCGQNHSTMMAKCVVQTQEQFDAWLKDASTWEDKISYLERGRNLRSQVGCATCHSIDGQGSTGPTWKDLYGSHVDFENGIPSIEHADDAYIKESIIDPGAKIVKKFTNAMPSNFRGQLSDHDIDALTWYMKSISDNYKDASGKRIDLTAWEKKLGPPKVDGSSTPTPPVTAPAP